MNQGAKSTMHTAPKPHAATKPAVKPAAKSAAPASPSPQPAAKRPASRGIYMDFTPRRSPMAHSVKPPVQSVTRTVRRSTIQPARPVVTRPATPVRKTVVQPVAAVTAVKTVETVEEIDYGVLEDYQSKSTSIPPQPVNPAPSPIRKSPFLSSINVPKRPLSNHVPNPDRPKNIYPRRKPAESHMQTHSTVIKPTAKKSKLPLVILILITIVLGAVAGAVVYLFFFSH